MVAEREFTRRMLQTVLTVTAAVIVLAVVWAARSALMVIYVSGSSQWDSLRWFASSNGREVRQARSSTHRRDPGRLSHNRGRDRPGGLIVVPPLVDQAGELWEAPPSIQ